MPRRPLLVLAVTILIALRSTGTNSQLPPYRLFPSSTFDVQPPALSSQPNEVSQRPSVKNAKIPPGGDSVSTEAVAARRHAGTHLPVTWWKLEMPITTWHLLL